MSRPFLIVCALLWVVVPVRGQAPAADDERGLLATVFEAFGGDDRAESGLGLLRQALREAEQGGHTDALDTLDAARVELPGSALVAQARGDVHAVLEQWESALKEYARGARDGFEFRSAFNSGVVRARQSEALLEDTLVGLQGEGWRQQLLVPSNLPEGPQPELLEALQSALPRHRAARLSFLRALADRGDAAARESVAALNRRLDELQAMRDELLEREQEQDQQDEGEDGDESDEQDESEQEQDQDEQEQDEQDQQQDGQDEQQQDQQDEQGEEEQQPPPESETQAEVAPTQLTPQQLAELKDKLEELEQVALELQRRQRENARRGVEKDW